MKVRGRTWRSWVRTLAGPVLGPAKGPTGIAVDFDRDGTPDLATSDLFTNAAGVLLNRLAAG